MEQKLLTLKNGQVKAFYEYFANLLNQDGKNAAFSYMIYQNVMILSAKYNEIMSTIYDERKDAAFMEFVSKANDLLTKYADRNEQGDVIMR